MKVSALHIKFTGIVQITGALLGILSGIFIDPLGGHPSLSVLIGMVVIPLNFVLALAQIVILLMLFKRPSSGQVTKPKLLWAYVVAGWLSTVTFIGWQWPPLFF
jgi:hypothetical protein